MHPNRKNGAFVRQLELNSLTPELLPAVLDLDQRCLGGLWTREGYQRELDSPNSQLLIVQARSLQSDQPIDVEPIPPSFKTPAVPPILACGCYWAILDEAHITIVMVHPDYQRQGLGQALVYGLLTSAHQQQLARATLEVRPSNTTALSLYQRFEFREAGRRRRYYQDTGEDALILWRSGLQWPNFTSCLSQWRRQVELRLQQADWQLWPSPPAAQCAEPVT